MAPGPWFMHALSFADQLSGQDITVIPICMNPSTCCLYCPYS